MEVLSRGEPGAGGVRRSLWRIAAVLVVTMVGGGLIVWAALERFEDQQEATERTAEELHDFVLAETREEELEQANACNAAHVRYEQFLAFAEDLTHAGATVGTDAHLSLLGATPAERDRAHALIAELLPAQVQPIIDDYPPPECDRAAALRRIEEG